MWKARRRRQLRLAAFPQSWREALLRSCPLYSELPQADQAELEGHIQVFLAEKRFEGCGGATVTDEVRLVIAAQACLLLLHRASNCYPAVRSVVLYPSSFLVPSQRHLGSGITEEGSQVIAGEAWREGVVVLAVDAACGGRALLEQGYNVVLHEFAHELDYEDGWLNGVPALAEGQPRRLREERHASWARVMSGELERLREAVQNGEPTALDAYGATNAPEFFAVCTESFFGRPNQLHRACPELYRELSRYYRQDPRQWRSPTAEEHTERATSPGADGA